MSNILNLWPCVWTIHSWYRHSKHICVLELSLHGIIEWWRAWLALSHRLNQSWIVNKITPQKNKQIRKIFAITIETKKAYFSVMHLKYLQNVCVKLKLGEGLMSLLIEARRRMYMYASANWLIIGSDNGLLPTRYQAIMWPKTGILSMRPSGRHFNEIVFELQQFPLKMQYRLQNGNFFLSRPQCVKV